MRRKPPSSNRLRLRPTLFLSFLDRPYFLHSEFRDVLLTSMGLSTLLPLSPRLVWSRVRAAMCSAIPGGFARPRRLSHVFLAAERAQLRQFRTDARNVLRGRPLQSANDPATGERLPSEWWARYRCPPPAPPTSGTTVLVAGGPRPFEAVFLALDGEDTVRVRLRGIEKVVSDLDVMLMGEVETPTSPLLLSPLPAMGSPAAWILSPPRTLPARQVELELDMGQLAAAVRLLDRKQDLLQEMRVMNDRVERDAAPPGPVMRERYAAIVKELDEIAGDLALPGVPPGAHTPADMGRVLPLLTRPGVITPSPVGSGRTRRRTPTTVVGNAVPGPQQPLPALRPEHLAKNVDFRNARGAALLAKALTRAALAKLGPDSKLKMAPTKVRADVMECVSACVAVLVRARATRDFRCIEEVVEDIRVRFPGNREALEAIHAAARAFDSSSSESSR